MSKKSMIVVAEPEEAIRESVALVLEDEQYDCLSVPDLQSLLDTLRDCRPDLILVDLDILHDDLDSFRSAYSRFSISPPLLVIRSYDNPFDLEGFESVAFLIKPFFFDELLHQVESLLSPRL